MRVHDVVGRLLFTNAYYVDRTHAPLYFYNTIIVIPKLDDTPDDQDEP